MKLILASASPRRSELLRQLSLDFKVVPADVAEIHREQLTARELSQVNAYRKARVVAKKFPDALVLAADTLVYLEVAPFGKPATLPASQGRESFPPPPVVGEGEGGGRTTPTLYAFS